MNSFLVTFYRKPNSGWEVPQEIRRREAVLAVLTEDGENETSRVVVDEYKKAQGLVLDSLVVSCSTAAKSADVIELIKKIYPHAHEVRAVNTEENHP